MIGEWMLTVLGWWTVACAVMFTVAALFWLVSVMVVTPIAWIVGGIRKWVRHA